MKNPTLEFHKFKDALRYALVHYSDDKVKKGKALRHIAKSLVNLAINGESTQALSAIRELADRLDGKPIQAIAGVEGEPITVVQRVIVNQVIENDTDSPVLTINNQSSKLIN